MSVTPGLQVYLSRYQINLNCRICFYESWPLRLQESARSEVSRVDLCARYSTLRILSDVDTPVSGQTRGAPRWKGKSNRRSLLRTRRASGIRHQIPTRTSTSQAAIISEKSYELDASEAGNTPASLGFSICVRAVRWAIVVCGCRSNASKAVYAARGIIILAVVRTRVAPPTASVISSLCSRASSLS